MKPIILVLSISVLTVLFLGCGAPKDKCRRNKRYFKDYDLFKMKGTNELKCKSVSYPYVEVTANVKGTLPDTLTFFVDEMYQLTLPITKREGRLYSIRKYQDSGTTLYDYYFLGEDSVSTFSFRGNPEEYNGAELVYVQVAQNHRIKKYTFNDSTYVSFDSGGFYFPSDRVDRYSTLLIGDEEECWMIYSVDSAYNYSHSEKIDSSWNVERSSSKVSYGGYSFNWYILFGGVVLQKCR